MSPITLERPPLAGCILRVVRPTDQMDAVVAFYRDGLGFPELTRFSDHDGFDGAILGFPGAPYHLEFTRAHGRSAGRAPTPDNLLVVYMPDARAWSRMIGVMQRREDQWMLAKRDLFSFFSGARQQTVDGRGGNQPFWRNADRHPSPMCGVWSQETPLAAVVCLVA